MYSLKFICNLKINTHRAITVIPEHAQVRERSESPCMYFLNGGQTIWCSAFLFQLSDYKCVLFVVCFLPVFSHFCTFLLVISLFIMGSCIALKYCLTFLSAESLWCPYRENPCVCNKFHLLLSSGMLAMTSVLINQQYILTKVSLNGNAHEIRWHIDSWQKCDQRLAGT